MENKILRDIDAEVLNMYDVSHEVGKGAYGTVYKAAEKRTGQPKALKKCNKVLLHKSEAHQTFREVYILHGLSQANHPYLVNLEHVMKGSCQNNGDLYLIFEFL